MKIFACPDECPAPVIDFTSFDVVAEDAKDAKEEAHKKDLKDFLINKGYSGKNTGREFRVPYADSCARYMFVEAPNGSSFLIHLPYGDAWNSPDVAFLPKKEVIRRMGGHHE